MPGDLSSLKSSLSVAPYNDVMKTEKRLETIFGKTTAFQKLEFILMDFASLISLLDKPWEYNLVLNFHHKFTFFCKVAKIR